MSDDNEFGLAGTAFPAPPVPLPAPYPRQDPKGYELPLLGRPRGSGFRDCIKADSKSFQLVRRTLWPTHPHLGCVAHPKDLSTMPPPKTKITSADVPA